MTSPITPSKSHEDVLLLRPTRGLAALNLKDLWVYRELVYFMVWRDLKVRFKQTLLGATWAILQPVVQMVIFTLIFSGVAKLYSDGLPYPVFNYSALLPWGLFAKALGDAGRSLVTNRSMITKVYFPRLVIPVSSVISGLVDFAIAFVVFIGIIIFYHYRPTANFDFHFTPTLLTLPLFLLLAMVTSLGVSLWLSAMNVMYRDVGYVIPFLTQIWLFITPVLYSATVIKGPWQWIYAINPMTGVVEGFRWALFGTEYTHLSMLAISTVVSIIILISGLFYFRSMERSFADEI
jgi:lipopolysaccharide transport system permease protein